MQLGRSQDVNDVRLFFPDHFLAIGIGFALPQFAGECSRSRDVRIDDAYQLDIGAASVSAGHAPVLSGRPQ
jgi:hypothetical protein